MSARARLVCGVVFGGRALAWLLFLLALALRQRRL